ncbi:MAG: sugar-binding protein [bacterium]
MKKIEILSTVLLSSFLILMLSSPSEAASKTGLLMVGETSSPPQIDGILNDSCWRKAIEVSPFILKNQNKFAKEQTKVYLCYDKDNLYLAFRCEASCLNPVNQQLDAFEKDTKANDDDKLFKDDCIVILLDTNRDKNTFFDIFINGQGAINDAKCEGKNPWRDRDKKWNSKAKVSTKIENSYWGVEMSIPFSSLNTTVKERDFWGICLGRIEQNKKEASLWQPMESGFHNAKEFGRIVFGKDIPGIRSVKLGRFNTGKNSLKFKAINNSEKSRKIRIGIELGPLYKAKERQSQDYVILPDRIEDIDFLYTLSREGEINFRYYLQNPSNFKNYYQSPLYSLMVESASIKISIKSKGEYKLYLNNEEIDKEAPLYQGKNIIRIDTDDKDIEASFLVGEERFNLDKSWEYSKEEKSNTFSFKRTILFHQSKIWPPNGAIYIARGSTTEFWHLMEGIKGEVLKDYRFCLEVPEGTEIIGATCFYKKNFVALSSKNIKRNGKNYKKYILTLEKPIPFAGKEQLTSSATHCYIGIKALKDVKEENKMYYYIETEGMSEIPNAVPIRVLPALQGKRPKKICVDLWGGCESRGESLSLVENIFATLKMSGVKSYGFSPANPEMLELIRKYEIKTFTGTPWPFGIVQFNQEHPEFQRIDKDGNRQVREWCSNAFKNKEFLNYIEKFYTEYQKKCHVDEINWDIEHPPFTGPTSCYCPKCLNDFRKYAGLSGDTKLNYEIIKSKYREQWIDFSCQQIADVAAVHRKIIKKNNPEVMFSIYTGYQTLVNRDNVCTDWKLYGKYCEKAICGYGRPRKKYIENTRKILQGCNVPLVGGILLANYRYNVMEPTTQATKAKIMRRLLDCGGVMVYTNSRGLDGRTYYALAETTRFISDYESLFISHQKDNSLVEVSGMSPDDVTVFTDGKTRLILLVNESNTKKKVRVINQKFSKKMKVYDYYKEKDLGNLGEIITEIFPHDVEAFVVTAVD